MRRMLDPTKVGGIPSTIEFDKDGNRKVKKNLGVDGKLTLQSLVSASNPDGDITKELGGGNKLYEYTAFFIDDKKLGVNRQAKFYSSVDIGVRDKNRTSEELFNQLVPSGSGYEIDLNASGCVKITDTTDTYYPIIKVTISASKTSIYYLDPSKGKTQHPNTFWNTSSIWNVIRNVASPRQSN